MFSAGAATAATESGEIPYGSQMCSGCSHVLMSFVSAGALVVVGAVHPLMQIHLEWGHH